MATTTAAITISSADLLTDPLSLSTTSTLYKAGTSTGLEQVKMGKQKLATGTNFKLLLATTAGANSASKAYIINKSTDATYYITVSVSTQVIGKLYAGDWMFIPWEQAATSQDLYARAYVGENTVEWASFHEGETLTS
jgi:hypothetical protein